MPTRGPHRERRADDPQKIRRALVWPEPELPRTEGNAQAEGGPRSANGRKVVRRRRRLAQAGSDALAVLMAKYAGRSDLTPQTTLEELGLTSLDRVGADGGTRRRVSDADRRGRVL